MEHSTRPDHAAGRPRSAACLRNLFGALAQRAGFVTQVQVHECRRIQELEFFAGRNRPRIGAVMVNKGYLSPRQLRIILAAQGKLEAARLPPGPSRETGGARSAGHAFTQDDFREILADVERALEQPAGELFMELPPAV